MSLASEIGDILSSHAGQPIDYVALFMFLNTVAGGHYEERHTEAALRAALHQLLAEGVIEAWEGDHQLEPPPPEIIPGTTTCHFRLGQGS